MQQGKKKRQQAMTTILCTPIEIKIKPIGIETGQLWTEEVMKVVRHEYACKYLELMKIECNSANVEMILKHKPLSKCKIETGGTASEVDLP
jgi:hypothetical protein